MSCANRIAPRTPGFAAEQRLIRKPFQVSDWVEPRFLDAALTEQAQASR
ncbi:hypothetical protein N5C55_25290 [Pseudomonas otitidis]|uniref:Uncharacterized protein n=1 Tax=Metapseudomonas otitidis TaxID=319939 RepID=A0ABU3XUA9_9GAMM|nr:hypothetical protein [Pseudomonas otitidis]MDH1110029.1 hypothetical protein [Pseudomonas otitidis]MDH1161504.1 hypothetical protein [Pseudomonas otitidis]MDH1165237.1 hypothetical protein [Pseudomonas otitidis]MDV3441497.1 hypothetical protein [Pseudomonas otitidis]MEE1892898.1 hypothetical protein [Pseudomonas otitidis]